MRSRMTQQLHEASKLVYHQLKIDRPELGRQVDSDGFFDAIIRVINEDPQAQTALDEAMAYQDWVDSIGTVVQEVRKKVPAVLRLLRTP